MKSSGSTDEKLLALLANAQKKRTGSAKLTEDNGKPSSYSRKVKQLKAILAGKETASESVMRDAGNAFYNAAEKASSDKEITAAKSFMRKSSEEEKVDALRSAVKRRGEKVGTPAYWKRVRLLKKRLAE
jgi:hypothetical protein